MLFLSHPFALVLATACAGIVCSLVAQHFLIRPGNPKAQLNFHSWSLLLLHAGIWLLVHSVLVLCTARPLFSLALSLAIFIILILVNNAKYKSLEEPFIFQDYDYFLDTIRCPRLFLPFFGVKAFMLATLAVLAALFGFFMEVPPAQRFQADSQAGALVLLTLSGLAFIHLALRSRLLPRLTFDPTRDLLQTGFLNALFLYARAQSKFPNICSPLHSLLPSSKESLAQPAHGSALESTYSQTDRAADTACATISDSPYQLVCRKKDAPLPHLVCVQSESFFDPRPLWDGIRTDVLASLDRLQGESCRSGHMMVPARGANTIRTEFAVLTGIEEQYLGIHRFNPYRALAHGWKVFSLPLLLKHLGYTTICLHPYMGSFYFRKKIFPDLGIDQFEDVKFFQSASRDGAYVADSALAARILECLAKASRPTFVLAITMENHGPLHLEKPDGISQELYLTKPLPADCMDLLVYLRHLKNADAMIKTLQTHLAVQTHPASLCWYGDHIPIMPQVYATFGEPDGTVPYALWNNPSLMQQTAGHSSASSLASLSTLASGSSLSVPAPLSVQPYSLTDNRAETVKGQTITSDSTMQAHDLALHWLACAGLVHERAHGQA